MVGDSLLGISNATSVHEAMDALDGGTAIADLGIGVSATRGALALECPSEATRLSSVLGDVNGVSFHHF